MICLRVGFMFNVILSNNAHRGLRQLFFLLCDLCKRGVTTKVGHLIIGKYLKKMYFYFSKCLPIENFMQLFQQSIYGEILQISGISFCFSQYKFTLVLEIKFSKYFRVNLTRNQNGVSIKCFSEICRMAQTVIRDRHFF